MKEGEGGEGAEGACRGCCTRGKERQVKTGLLDSACRVCICTASLPSNLLPPRMLGGAGQLLHAPHSHPFWLAVLPVRLMPAAFCRRARLMHATMPHTSRHRTMRMPAQAAANVAILKPNARLGNHHSCAEAQRGGGMSGHA